MNPIVGDLCSRRLGLHHLHNSTIGLQMANIPHFVVEDLRRITNGKNRGCTGEVNAVVGEVHVSASLVNRDHQSLLVSS